MSPLGQLSMVGRRLPFITSPSSRPLKVPKSKPKDEYTFEAKWKHFQGLSARKMDRKSLNMPIVDCKNSYIPTGQILSEVSIYDKLFNLLT